MIANPLRRAALRSMAVVIFATGLASVLPAESADSPRQTADRWAEAAFARPRPVPAGSTAPVGLIVLQKSHQVLVNRTVWNTPITLGEKPFEHGIYMDAPAVLLVRLAKPAVAFSALVGIDNNRDTRAAPTVSSARFHVVVEGKRVFSSPVRRLADQALPASAPLDGRREFLIETDDGGDGRSHDQCVWADARITFADGSVLSLDQLPLRPSGKNRSNVPVSFVYGGRPSDELLPGWSFEKKTSPVVGGQKEVLILKDASTGLSIETQITRYDDASAVDWTCWLENRGAKDTPLISELLPLDAAILSGLRSDEPVVLRWSNGDRCDEDSYLPHDEPLAAGQPRSLAGHSSDTAALPFFNLQGPGGGWILAIGWTGRWKAEFHREPAGSVCVRAGMQATGFRLRPGEKVRTPRIVLFRWNGDRMIDGHNQFRRFMLAHCVPRLDGRPAEPPVAYSSVAGLYCRAQASKKPLERLNEAYEQRMIPIAAELGCEAYWMDAYWFPQPWDQNMGNWSPRPEDFPRGLRPLADAAHQRGLKFVLWFAPLWVSPGTPWARDCAQFIHGGGAARGGLWKAGDPAALAWVTDRISDCIRRWDVDIYRQDIDGAMPPDEGPDRLGIAEMKHVEGFYRFWQELRRRHPRLLIDNCCGGGRRIDMETSCLAFTLWHSDFNDIGEGLKGKAHWPMMGRADQVMTAGLSLYVPFHTGPVWDMRPYSFRSAMTSGIVLYNDLESPDFSKELARQAIAELKQLRPYFQGDLYPLLNLTASQRDWHAFQLDRPDLGAGCVLAFRRPESPDNTRPVRLERIDPHAEYLVSITAETFERAAQTRTLGRNLSPLTVRMDTRPGSVLIRYQRTDFQAPARAEGKK